MAVSKSEIESSARIIQRKQNQKAIELLETWVSDGDSDEQRETFEALKRGLIENNSSGRPAFT